MSVEIVIDTREPTLQALLQTYYQNAEPLKQDNISMKIQPLDVGDVQITFGNTIVLFERKTCADLAASIKDSRYREQKIRILTKTLPRHVIYIIEGIPSQQTLLNSDFPIHGLKPSVLSGAIIYTMLRDGMHVISVANTAETAAWIWNIAMKCSSNPEKLSVGGELNTEISTNNNYLQSIKTKKIDNITPNTCYILQLCQIPNISISTAQEIAKVYPNMLTLLTTLSSIQEENSRIKLLSDIKMIGKKKAEIIIKYLFP